MLRHLDDIMSSAAGQSTRPPEKTLRQRLIEAAEKGDNATVGSLLAEVKIYDGQDVYDSLKSQAIGIIRNRDRRAPPPHGWPLVIPLSPLHQFTTVALKLILSSND